MGHVNGQPPPAPQQPSGDVNVQLRLRQVLRESLDAAPTWQHLPPLPMLQGKADSV